MRIWLSPAKKLNQHALMPFDVRSAIEAQNTEECPQVRSVPAPAGQQLTATITARSKASFRRTVQIVVKSAALTASVVRIGDRAGRTRQRRLPRHRSAPFCQTRRQPVLAILPFSPRGHNAITAPPTPMPQKLDELQPFFDGMETTVT
jgi:hypothetical protein